MQVMSVIQCDSMDSDDLDSIQQSILEKDGPTLGQINHTPSLPNGRTQVFTPMNSLQFIRSLPKNKDVKYIGSNQEAQLRAFYYILLYLAIQQKKYYPKLRSLMQEKLLEYGCSKASRDNSQSKCSEPYRQQNPSSGIISEKKVGQKSVSHKFQKYRHIVLEYFNSVEQLWQIDDFILKCKDFDLIWMRTIKSLLNNNLDQHQQPYRNTYAFYEKMSDIFCIKWKLLTLSSHNYRSYSFGENGKFFVIMEGWYAFVIFHNIKNKKQDKQIHQKSENLIQSNALQASKYRQDRPIASSAIVLRNEEIGLKMADSFQYQKDDSNYFDEFNAFFNQEKPKELFKHQFLQNNQQASKKKKHKREPRNSEGCLAEVQQASDESTPKFLEEQSEMFIRIRRKSHKNSFGGEIQISNYTDIQHSVVKRLKKKKVKERKPSMKAKSARFEAHQISQQFQLEDQLGLKNRKKISKRNPTELPLWGSHCLPQIDKKNDSVPEVKKKKLSSSAVAGQWQQLQEQKIRNRQRLSVGQGRKHQQDDIFNPRISFARNQQNRFIQQPTQLENHENIYRKYSQNIQYKRQPNKVNQIKRFYEAIPINQSKHTAGEPELDNSYQNFIRQYEQMLKMQGSNSKHTFDQIFASKKIHQSQHIDQYQESRVQSQVNDALLTLLDPILRNKLRNRKFSQFNAPKEPMQTGDYYKLIGMNFLKKLQQSRQEVIRKQDYLINQSLDKGNKSGIDENLMNQLIQRAISSPNRSLNNNSNYQISSPPMPKHNKIEQANRAKQQQLNKVRQLYLKKRFEQNSLRFSELNDPTQGMILQQDETSPKVDQRQINQRNFNPLLYSPRLQSKKSSKKYHPNNLRLYSNIISYQNFNSEPSDWIKKQTTYHFLSKPQQTRVVCRNQSPRNNSVSIFSISKPQNVKKKKNNKNKKQLKSQDNNTKQTNTKSKQQTVKYSKQRQEQYNWNKPNHSYLSEKEFIQNQLLQQSKQRKYTFNAGDKIQQKRQNDSGMLNNSNSFDSFPLQFQPKKPISTEIKEQYDQRSKIMKFPESQIGFRDSDLKNRQFNIRDSDKEIYNVMKAMNYSEKPLSINSHIMAYNDQRKTIKIDTNEKGNTIIQNNNVVISSNKQEFQKHLQVPFYFNSPRTQYQPSQRASKTFIYSEDQPKIVHQKEPQYIGGYHNLNHNEYQNKNSFVRPAFQRPTVHNIHNHRENNPNVYYPNKYKPNQYININQRQGRINSPQTHQVSFNSPIHSPKNILPYYQLQQAPTQYRPNTVSAQYIDRRQQPVQDKSYQPSLNGYVSQATNMQRTNNYYNKTQDGSVRRW